MPPADSLGAAPAAPDVAAVDARPSGGGGPSLTAADVARMVGGSLHAGDPARQVRRVAALDRAGPDELTFFAAAKYASAFERTRAGVVLVTPALADAAGAASAARVVVGRPHEAVRAVLQSLYPEPPRPVGIHSTAVIAPDARLGPHVYVGPHAVIGPGAAVGARAWIDAGCVLGEGVEVGDDVRLHPGVTLYAGTRLGHRVIVHAGARLGSDGFGYVFADGAHQKIPHVGRCVIEDDVEIGANTSVDRGSIGDTVVGAGTKIDNLVHLGHNVRVGRQCLIMAQVGVAGSAVLEDGVVLAGQVGVGGHVTIGARAQIGGQAGVFGDVPAGATWSGYPARPHKDSLRATAATFRVASIIGRLERLVQRVDGGGDGERR